MSKRYVSTQSANQLYSLYLVLYLYQNMTALALLKGHLERRLGANVPQLDHVLAHFEPVEVERGAVLLRQGEACKLVYFVGAGCLQVYATDADGAESTRDIATEDSWVSELTSFGTGAPAAESIRAVEASTLAAISQAGFAELMQTVPQFQEVYRAILEASYANAVYRINTFMALDALGRIRWLMQHRPALMNRLPGKLMASYLGIQHETFSRLRPRA